MLSFAHTVLRKIIQNWGIPLLILFAVAISCIVVAIRFEKSEKSYYRVKSKQIADGIAANLKSEIQNRASIFKTFALEDEILKAKVYEKMASAYVETYKDFHGINLVDRHGVIQAVYPTDKNQAAYKKNLMLRPEIKSYLIESKNKKEMVMSHLVMTYQGFPAFTFYLPIFQNDNFVGWLNAVIDFKNWLADFLKSHNLTNIRVLVKWMHPDSRAIDIGRKDAGEFFDYEYQVLNQKIKIQVGFAPSDLDLIRNKTYEAAMHVGGILLLISLMLIVMLNLSILRSDKVNENLTLKNNFLNSLCHDLSNPLTILSMNFTLLQRSEALALFEKQKNAMAHALKSMNQMLESARNFHTKELGILGLKLVPVKLSSSLQEVLDFVQYKAESKKIQINIKPISPDLRVLAEPSSLVNNVVINIFTNAIKFSPANSEISVSVEADEKAIKLIVEDEGSGLSEEQLLSFKKLSYIATTSGTENEKGTGLGLFQIKGFMSAYNGQVEIYNKKPNGCVVVLIFKNVS
ncbi:MAG: CHASE domain-containing protein [Bacteriovoracaceae bacterium]|nr:CHASE domain-containing protein [Bacteriovoracaceae bacterium]